MKIRFRKWTDSEVPGFPFRPGQVIDVEDLSPAFVTFLDDGNAEVVREDGDGQELAVVGSAETTAVVERPKGRRR